MTGVQTCALPICFPVTIQEVDLYGGDTTEEAAKIFNNVLKNKATSAQRDVVIANSAFAIQVIESQKSIFECIDMAKESLESGKALQVLNKFVELNSQTR